MTGLNSKHNKHLTLDDRIEIQECLSKGMSFKAIGRRISKDPTTISKEVKRNAVVKDLAVKRAKSDGTPLPPQECPLLLKAPFVCNPCIKSKGNYCAFQKRVYIAKVAQQTYEHKLKESREGISLNDKEFWEADKIIADGINQGQHIYQIVQSNDLGMSQSTVYRHIERGHLAVSNIDLPRKVKFKLRKKNPEHAIPRAAKIGRLHEDFLKYLDETDAECWAEMDTVEGRKGGKAILTLHLTMSNFMVGLLVDNLTSSEVSDKIQNFKMKLAAAGLSFGNFFPVLLTDNGGEFANFSAFTDDCDGLEESKLFFCDPYCSSQKARIEKNHTLLRDILPKGTSFDNLTQEQLNIIFSHINSTKRNKFGGNSPFDMLRFLNMEPLASAAGLTEVPAAEMIQNKRLLNLIGFHLQHDALTGSDEKGGSADV
jgi:IS30 family transposase